MQQNLMNKLNAKTMNLLLPLNHPSPDCKNKNRVAKTASPSQQVKKYLQSIKRNTHAQQGQNKSIILSNLLGNQDQTVIKNNEDILRKRINELEIENNEFRIFVKEYENLVGRNRELQEQMLLLLEQLESRGDASQESEKYPTEQQDTRRGELNSTKDKFYLTTQSSRSKTLRKSLQDSSKYGNSDSIEIKTIEPFNSITIDPKELIDQNSYLKIENQKIKELVDQEIKESIKSLEAKFTNFIASMEQKINQLNASNQDIIKRQLKKSLESDSKKSLQEENVNFHKPKNLKIHVNDKEWNKWDKSSHSSQLEEKNGLSEKSWNKGLYLHPARGSEKQQQFKKDQSKSSLVNIEGSCLSQSNQSFGKSNQKISSAKPDHHTFKNIQSIESQNLQNSNYQRSIIDRIWENLRNLRSNLTFILGETQIKQPNILEIQKSIQTEIKTILDIFFPRSRLGERDTLNKSSMEYIKNDDLLSECLQMRQKIRELNDQIIHLHQDVKLKVEQPFSPSPQSPVNHMRVASQIYLQRSYYMDLKSQYTVQFEETKRRLQDIISIMRSFNEQYHDILDSHSSRVLLVDSHKRIP